MEAKVGQEIWVGIDPGRGTVCEVRLPCSANGAAPRLSQRFCRRRKNRPPQRASGQGVEDCEGRRCKRHHPAIAVFRVHQRRRTLLFIDVPPFERQNLTLAHGCREREANNRSDPGVCSALAVTVDDVGVLRGGEQVTFFVPAQATFAGLALAWHFQLRHRIFDGDRPLSGRDVVQVRNELKFVSHRLRADDFQTRVTKHYEIAGAQRRQRPIDNVFALEPAADLAFLARL